MSVGIAREERERGRREDKKRERTEGSGVDEERWKEERERWKREREERDEMTKREREISRKRRNERGDNEIRSPFVLPPSPWPINDPLPPPLLRCRGISTAPARRSLERCGRRRPGLKKRKERNAEGGRSRTRQRSHKREKEKERERERERERKRTRQN